jgi:hypothetical protein
MYLLCAGSAVEGEGKGEVCTYLCLFLELLNDGCDRVFDADDRQDIFLVMARPNSHTYKAVRFIVDRVLDWLLHSAGAGVCMHVLVVDIALLDQPLRLHNHPLGNFVLDAGRIVYASP